jgi:uncharacterized membrane protein YkgB
MSTHVEARPALSSLELGEITRSEAIQSAGSYVLRYALVVVIVVFALAKFTAPEAAGIQPLVAQSPFVGWLYSFFSVQGASNAIGAAELVIAALLAARPISARAATAGSVLAAGMFATTLSFLFSTPGALSPMHPAHAFLLKDIVLLGAAIALGAEALRATGRAQPR